jgi:hypothetical protein
MLFMGDEFLQTGFWHCGDNKHEWMQVGSLVSHDSLPLRKGLRLFPRTSYSAQKEMVTSWTDSRNMLVSALCSLTYYRSHATDVGLTCSGLARSTKPVR